MIRGQVALPANGGLKVVACWSTVVALVAQLSSPFFFADFIKNEKSVPTSFDPYAMFSHET